MFFSPVLVVAAATFFSSSSTLASPLFSRQTDTNISTSGNIVDPHASPPVPAGFTSTISDGGEGWAEAFKKAQAIVSQMTIEEKVNVTTGFPGPCVGNTGSILRLGIPALCLQDGPLGVRPVDLVSQFPAGVNAAATWNHDLIYGRALAMGKEFKGKGVNIALSPVTGGPLGRSPLAGRNWEGFAPDVYLNGIASKLSVAGLQDAGVQACAKHFIAYEQESYRRLNLPAVVTNLTALYQQIDSHVDDKTLHELYLPGFAEAVRAGVASVMCAYNSVNGTHACGNDFLQNTVLKGELGFSGTIISDWGGTWSTEEDAAYGLDVTMPGIGFGGLFGDYFGDELVSSVRAGGVSEARLDDMAIRTLTPYYHLGQDSNYPKPNFDFSVLVDEGPYGSNEHVNVQEDHYKIIRMIGEESATLLKNVPGEKGLPITDATLRLGVFGDDAGSNPAGLTGCGSGNNCFDVPSDGDLGFTSSDPYSPPPTQNGTISTGGGSGSAYAPYVVTPLEAISLRARHTSMTVDYELNQDSDFYRYVDVVATNVDKAIVFVSAFQAETYDRQDLNLLHNGSELINRVALNCADVVVVINSGQTVDMEPWIQNENVTAVIFAYYPGQESGNSLTPILFGDASPSGKLPFTVGKSIDQYPGGSNSVIRDDVFTPVASFDEGLFIDYKWFDKQNSTPRFEFGFGLSYSNFTFSHPTIASTPSADVDHIQLTNETFEGDGGLYDILYTVGVTVQNTGGVDAAEVAQIYMTFPSSESDQPIRNLRGFCKEKYGVGESQTLTFPIRAKDLTVWSVLRQAFYIPSGEFTFSIGSSSRDLPVSITLRV